MGLSPAKKKVIRRLALLDYLSAALAWAFFWPYRQQLLGNAAFADAWKLIHPKDIIVWLIIIPGGWLFLYLLSGTYFDLYRKSRLNEINRTLISCILGSVF